MIRCFRGGGGSSGGRDNGGVVVLALRAVKPAGAVALGAHGCATISASRGFIAGVATGPRSPWRADAPVAHCRATVGTPVSDILRLTSGAGVAGWAEAFGQVGDATVLADDWKRGGGGGAAEGLGEGTQVSWPHHPPQLRSFSIIDPHPSLFPSLYLLVPGDPREGDLHPMPGHPPTTRLDPHPAFSPSSSSSPPSWKTLHPSWPWKGDTTPPQGPHARTPTSRRAGSMWEVEAEDGHGGVGDGGGGSAG